MDLKCSVILPLVGSSHLCDIRVHSGGIFNRFDSWKTSKAAFRFSQGSTSWVLVLGSHIQEWVPAWFIVGSNGFKRNFWTWSSKKSLAWFLWWLQRNFLEIQRTICVLHSSWDISCCACQWLLNKPLNLISMLREKPHPWKKPQI